MPAKVISAFNEKGGVGKTTLLFHVAGEFARRGLKVLLIDHEPQHSLSNNLLGLATIRQLHSNETIAAIYDDACEVPSSRLIHSTAFRQISIVPSCDALKPYNDARPEEAGAKQVALREFIGDVKPQFDIILIDCPSNLALCTWASLTASDAAYSPTLPEDFGAQGTTSVRAMVDAVMSATNPNLRFLGFVLNMVDRRLSIHKAYERSLREHYGHRVFSTSVPHRVDFKEGVAARKPIAFYKPNSPAAQCIADLVDELTDRMADCLARPPQLQNEDSTSAFQPRSRCEAR